ncbi:MAG: ABC transporter ATP-binding protein [Deltaproteobacteria bacterium]|nr:ABC transporter ATP-binding protein [Deltaproteobacteria bacterium]
MQKEYKTVFSIILNNKKFILITLTAALLEAMILIGVPVIAKYQLEILEKKFYPEKNLLDLFFVFTVIGILISITLSLIRAVSKIYDTYLQESLSMDMDKELYKKLASLDSGFLSNPRNRKLIYVFFEIGQLPHSVLSFLKLNIKSIISFFAVLPLIALSSFFSSSLIVLTGIIQIFIFKIRLKRENSFRLHKEKQLAAISELIWLYRYNYHELAETNGESQTFPKYWENRRAALELEVKHEKISSFWDAMLLFLDAIVIGAITLILGKKVLSSEMSIGTYSMIIMFSVQLLTGITELNSNAGEWYRIKSVFSQLGFFLNMEPRISIPDKPQEIDISNINLLSVNSIRFTYPGLMDNEIQYLNHLIGQLKVSVTKNESWSSDHELINEWRRLLEESQIKNPEVIKNISLTFKRGEISAIVGPNGCGKTTLMRLLNRSYDPDSGFITAGGTPVKSLSIDQIKSMVTFVPQTPFILEAFSLRDNILLGCGETSDDEINTTLHNLGIKNLVDSLPNGLDSILGNDVSLSGGQYQLVVIARAILQKRPILILDEGTNQLDSEHEAKIINLLRKEKENRITILITHQMSTAKKSDLIYVMENGEIKQKGNHESLVNNEGLYKKFWNIQILDKEN